MKDICYAKTDTVPISCRFVVRLVSLIPCDNWNYSDPLTCVGEPPTVFIVAQQAAKAIHELLQVDV